MQISDRIDVLVSELNSLLPMKSEFKQVLDKKFRLEFNFNSNHMEGNTLTYNETELLLMFDDAKGNHTLREYEEMKAHDVAYQYIEELAADKERPLTEQIIKSLNEIILVRPFWKDAQTPEGQATRRQIKVGDYKEFPNSVRLQNGEMFHYASPTDTPIKMGELLDWYRTQEAGLHPLTLAAMLHYKFVRIHPFDDGNGRISRLLMNYVLLKNGLPPIVIKSTDKTSYLSALHLADIGDYEPFIEYIGQQLEWSLELSIKAAKGESVEEDDDIDKEIKLLKYNQQKQVEKLTPVILNKTYLESIRPLIEEFINQLQVYDDMFVDKKIKFHMNSDRKQIPVESLNALDNVFDGFVFENLNNMALTNYPSEIYGIEVAIAWNGYKNAGVNTFDTNANVKFEFEDFRYKFSCMYTAAKQRMYLYQDIISKEQADLIIKEIKKAILNNIKVQIQSTNI